MRLFGKIILDVTIIGLMPVVFANALPPANERPLQPATVAKQESQPTAQSDALVAVTADFGTYVVQPQFTAVERNGNPIRDVVAEFGSRQVVKAQAAPSGQTKTRVRTNTVVRNLISGDLGIVTGRLTILTQDSVALANAINSLGLKKLNSINHGTVVIVEAPADADLLAIQTKLKAVSGVRKVKLDVLEKLQKPN
jgi:hypothetical protein